jgi:hypothetical protein
MPSSSFLLVSVGWLLFGLAAMSGAQVNEVPRQRADEGAADVLLSPEQVEELTGWVSAMEKWQRADAKRSGTFTRDWLGRPQPPRAAPEAPRWLAASCDTLRTDPADTDLLTAACGLLENPRAPMRQLRLTSSRGQEEVATRSSFLTRLHLDGMWTTAGSNNRSYGLVGAHLSLVDVGRVQVFGPPGVLLVSIPDGTGSRRVTLGYTWGISIRLMDVRLFGGKDMTLFVNVTKVWVESGVEDRGMSRGHDIVGLSLAPRGKR